MAVTEKIKSMVKFLVNGFDQEEIDFDDMASEIDEIYPTQDNLAIEPQPTYEKKEEKKVAQFPTVNRGQGHEIVFIEPRSFEDSAVIAQDLKDRKTIVLNLRLLDKEQSQRTIDFICGAAHALNGKPQKVDEKVFVFTPSNVSWSIDTNTVNQDKFDQSIWRTSMGSVQ